MKKRYDYSIATRLGNKKYRLSPFRLRNPYNADSNHMFAYLLKYPNNKYHLYNINNINVKPDTIELFITKSQADTIFFLTKQFFATVDISNYYSDSIFKFQTDDVGGEISLDDGPLKLTATIPGIHTSSIKKESIAFLKVNNYFTLLFSKGETQSHK